MKIMKKMIINTRKKQKEKRSICIINKAIDDICNVKVNQRNTNDPNTVQFAEVQIKLNITMLDILRKKKLKVFYR